MRSVIATLGLSARLRGNSLRAQIVRGTSGTVGLKVINSGLLLLTTIVLARVLGATAYGAYAYAISWVSLLVIPAIVGLDTLLTREVARYRATENWPALKGILGWSDRVVVATSLTIAAGLALIVGWRSDVLDPIVADSLWASVILLPFLTIVQVRGGSTRGLGAVIEAQFPMLVVLPLIFLGFVVGMHLIADLTAPRAIGLRAASAMVAAIVAIWLLRRVLPLDTHPAIPRFHRRAWFKSAVPLLFLGGANALNQQVGVLMLGSIVGSEAAGIYDVARRMAMLVSLVLIAINMPLGPIIADLHVRGEAERLQAVLVKSARVAAALSCLIAFALIGFGPWILRLMGEEFTAGLPVLTVLCLGGILNAAAGSVALVLNMTGHERETLKGVGIAAVTNLLLNALLIPHWGILGAGVASALSTLLWNVLLVIWIWRHLGLHPTVLATPSRRRAR